MEGDIAVLNGPAARMLLFLLLADAQGRQRVRAGEIKAGAGIARHSYFEAARKQLEGVGLARLEKRGHLYEITHLAFHLNGSRRDGTDRWIDRETCVMNDLSIYRNTGAEPADLNSWDQAGTGLDEKLGSIIPDLNWGQESSKVPQNHLKTVPESGSVEKLRTIDPKSTPKPPQKYLETVPELQREALEVDGMDASGNVMHMNSPAQVRRRLQVAIVQKVWEQFFGDELLAANAKFFLRGCNESAAEVYDFFERVKSFNPNNPLTYARRILENERGRVVEAPVYTPSQAVLTEEELRQVEERTRAARIKLWRRWHPDGDIPADF
jgi:hypothetical protein